MATSGEKEIDGSSSLNSEGYSSLFCSPCRSDGERLVGVGYCLTCNEILCMRCFDCHKVPSQMRNHHLLDKEQMLRKLRIMTGDVRAEHIKDINMRHQDDTRTCWIVGAVVMSQHRLAIADYSNSNIKVIDTKQQKVVSAINLTTNPGSVTKVTHTTVAASLPEKKRIVLIRTDLVLSIESEFGVDGVCRGVAYGDGKLVVGFISPHKVELMDVKGSVLRRIQTDGNGHALFDYPFHVAINAERRLVYVSNGGFENVVCLRLDGSLVATYKDSELRNPRHVIVDRNGIVYVCGYGSNNVHRLTEDCKQTQVFLPGACGTGGPHNISYEETEHKLYVTYWQYDSMKVYQLNHEYL